MTTFFNNLWSWIVQALTWLLDSFQTVFEWVMDALIYILKSILYSIFDGILITLQAAISAIDTSALVLQFVAGYGLIPTQAAYFMSAIGFPQFVTIIAAAYGIRLAINLIPEVEIFGTKVAFPKL